MISSIEMREIIIKAAHSAKHGHIPSALSLVEIMQAYSNIEKEDDVMVFSKGHGCLALYSLLAIQGHVPVTELFNFGRRGSRLGGHPDRNKLDKIYASTGALGHGFPIAVGAAMARKILKKDGRVFCVIGDGEANEGTIWESCIVASKNKLNNLVCIVDNNNSQTRSLPVEDLGKKFQSFGWKVWDIDGHDSEMISRAITDLNPDEKPTAVIANTIKGKGIKEIENDMFAWHHRAPTDEELERFCEEICES